MVIIKKELTAGIYVNKEGEAYFWESLPEEEQKNVGTALNDEALRAAGYHPVSEEEEEQADKNNN